METSVAAIRGFYRQLTGVLNGLAALQGSDQKSRREAKRKGLRLIGVTIFSGVIGALLMALVIVSARSVSSPLPDTDRLVSYEYQPAATIDAIHLMLFGICLCALVFCRRFVAAESAGLAESIVVGTRLRIVDQLRKAKLLQYEKAMRFEIASAMNQSTEIISVSAQMLANGGSAALMLVCAAFYIAILSGIAFVLTMGGILAGVIVYSLNFKKVKEEMLRSTELEKNFAMLFDHFSNGFKEVKLSQPRSEALYANYLAPNAREAGEVRKQTARRHANFAILNEVLLFVLLAIIIFILPLYSHRDVDKVVQISTVILFVMGPLAELVRAVPVVMLSHDAISRIFELEKHLTAAAETTSHVSEGTAAAGRGFEIIRLEGITFSYVKQVEAEFRLEFNQFELRAGELVFLIGGNGGGKSTLLKLLTGLYDPDSGSLTVDRQPVSQGNLADYRSLYSVVFADYHLFDRLYGLGPEAYPEVRRLLRLMEMDGLVSIDEEGRFADPRQKKSDPVSQLSTGQKKRLALVVALTENRPILVLDEFAADQDPQFRRKFYLDLLPELRRNRTIIAATHDEHFFGSARPDRVVELDFGRLRDVTSRYVAEDRQRPSE